MNNQTPEIQREELNELTGRVIGLCIEIHRHLGPGLLESAYEQALAWELFQAGLKFERQRDTPLLYKGVKLDCGYRLDFVIEGKLIVELKAVSELLPIHQAQVLTYLKLERRSLGLLINFNTPTLKDGIRRVVAGELFRDEQPARSNFGQHALLLCASASLWFRNLFFA
jgi:GxxExxY protein